MRFWLVRGKDGNLYITYSRRKPERVNDRATGWTIGFPGTPI